MKNPGIVTHICCPSYMGGINMRSRPRLAQTQTRELVQKITEAERPGE
jgi:hypothetical protein